MGRHEAGKAGDPAHDWFFSVFAGKTTKSGWSVVGTFIVILALGISLAYILLQLGVFS